MKIYYPKSHYNKAHRGLLFPLLKPFIKDEGFTDAARMATYGVSEKDFQITEHIDEADLVVLTMAWNYYVNTKHVALANNFIKECAIINKRVIAFNAGDFGVGIPYFKNLIILRPSGYLSKFTDNEYALPAFIVDPLKKYFNTTEIFEMPFIAKPVVGFCGQANPSLLNAGKEIISTGLRNLKSYMGFANNEVQQVLSTSFLRASVLKTLQNSEDVETNFILRKKYRAGVTTNKDAHKSTLEFYNNLKDSQYVVCVRGAGNFSVRLYETLAMGRIPVFVNTDCALPLDNLVDWKKHVVWVEYKERNKIASKVKEFHAVLSAEDFIDLQFANRTLWEEKLTLGGFFKILLDEI
jgi:hypothetical protein